MARHVYGYRDMVYFDGDGALDRPDGYEPVSGLDSSNGLSNAV